MAIDLAKEFRVSVQGLTKLQAGTEAHNLILEQGTEGKDFLARVIAGFSHCDWLAISGSSLRVWTESSKRMKQEVRHVLNAAGSGARSRVLMDRMSSMPDRDDRAVLIGMCLHGFGLLNSSREFDRCRACNGFSLCEGSNVKRLIRIAASPDSGLRMREPVRIQPSPAPF